MNVLKFLNTCFLSFLISCLLHSLSLEANWEHLYPRPTGERINCSMFLPDNNNLVIGTDAGTTAKYSASESDDFLAWSYNSNSLSTSNITSMATIGSSSSFATFSDVGPRCGILKSTNFANSWELSIELEQGVLNSIDFLTATNGIAVGYELVNAIILITSNGGDSWLPISINTDGAHLETIDMVSLNVGYTAGWWGTILKTIDGGTNWLPVNLPETIDVQHLHFLDELIGFAVCDNGKLYKTENGGESWVLIPTPTTNNLNFIASISSNQLLLAAENQTLLSSQDGGSSWVEIELPSSVEPYFPFDLTSIQVDNDSPLVYLTGDKGITLSSYDNGLNWESIDHRLGPETIYDLEIVNPNFMLLGLKNQFYFSFDGISFHPSFSYDWEYAENDNIYFLEFIPEEALLIACTKEYGLIHANFNTGQVSNIVASSSIDLPPFDILDMHFFDSQNGFVLHKNDLYKTADGGLNWMLSYQAPSSTPLTSMSFKNNQIGLLGTTANDILITTDGGENWEYAFNELGNESILDFHWGTDGRVYAAGDYTFATSITSGNTWTNEAASFSFKKIEFSSNNIGYAYSDNGLIYETSDGGTTWSINSSSSPDFYDIQLNTDQILYGYGLNGILYRDILDETPNPTFEVAFTQDAENCPNYNLSISPFSPHYSFYSSYNWSSSIPGYTSDATPIVGDIYNADQYFIDNVAPGTEVTVNLEMPFGPNVYSTTQTFTTPGEGTSSISLLEELEDGCSNELATLVGPNGNFDYLWSTGDTGNFIEVQESGIYSLTISTDCGSYALNNFELILNDGPIVTATPMFPPEVCDGETIQFTLDGASSYLWEDHPDLLGELSSPSQTFTPSNPENDYYYTAYSPDGCNTIGFVTAFVATYNSSKGNMTDSSNQPLSNAQLLFLQFDDLASGVQLMYDTFCSESGYFAYDSDLESNYARVLPNLDFNPNQLPTYYGPSLTIQDALQVSPDCDTTQIDIQTFEAMEAEGLSSIDGTIYSGSGKIESGPPIPDLTIFLMLPDGTPIAYTVTDSEGGFSFENIAIQDYLIWVDYPGIENSLAPVLNLTETMPSLSNLEFELTEDQLILKTISSINEGIENYFELSVNPNPINETSIIEGITAANLKLDFGIYDTKGCLIFTKSIFSNSNGNFQFNLGQLLHLIPTGMYFIRSDENLYQQVLKCFVN